VGLWLAANWKLLTRLFKSHQAEWLSIPTRQTGTLSTYGADDAFEHIGFAGSVVIVTKISKGNPTAFVVNFEILKRGARQAAVTPFQIPHVTQREPHQNQPVALEIAGRVIGAKAGEHK
jgi:hypothetical protein